MELEHPKPEHGHCDDHSRHAYSMTGAPDEEGEGRDDDGRSDRIGRERANEVTAKHVLHARRATA